MTLAADLPQPRTVSQCMFRTCDWTMEDTATQPPEIADDRIACHLLADHENALRILGHLAEEADLL